MRTFTLMSPLLLAVGLLAQNPDNSKVNQRDRDTQAVTPTEQGNSKEDLQCTADIRKEINKHRELSSYARNVKVITRDGTVNLRGPVRDEHERDMIGKIAQDTACGKQTMNDLEVAPKR